MEQKTQTLCLGLKGISPYGELNLDPLSNLLWSVFHVTLTGWCADFYRLCLHNRCRVHPDTNYSYQVLSPGFRVSEFVRFTHATAHIKQIIHNNNHNYQTSNCAYFKQRNLSSLRKFKGWYFLKPARWESCFLSVRNVTMLDTLPGCTLHSYVRETGPRS